MNTDRHGSNGAAVADEAIVRQERRLRFADPEWELRFNQERQEQGLNRARWLMILGLLVVCGIGAQEAAMNARRSPEYTGLALQHRFFYVAPLWLTMLWSTWRPGHVRRADWVFAGGTTLVCWALALNKWHYGFYYPGDSISTHVMIDVLVPLLVSSFALPMRFGPLAAMALASTVGPTVFFYLTVTGRLQRDAAFIASMLPTTGVLVGVLGWYREVGERRMFGQREQVKVLNAELARLNAEKNEFMAIAAHDLRAPLASVRGLSAQLRAGRMAEEEKRVRAHEAIHDLSGRMLGLVNAYLGAHAAESGALEVKRVRVDLALVAETARERHAAGAEAKGQRVSVVRERGEIFAQADEALLSQVMDNFVTNALKFSPHGAEVSIAVSASRADGRLRLAVKDAGPGIAAEEQAGLFKKFGRASTKPTGGEASHGLGLAVAKRLAEAMGGRVGCESRTGEGATFWVELPSEA
ncbi:MAG: HAMP domain-containing histidine kinase [Undibacterium sp.]|nr:HAMP domain-containing histidine kinase [Opitutaceae bacterium]